MRKTASGFTIVELLIVIVVIAILATISIVAYNGIQNMAHDSVVQSDLTQFTKAQAAAAVTDDVPNWDHYLNRLDSGEFDGDGDAAWQQYEEAVGRFLNKFTYGSYSTSEEYTIVAVYSPGYSVETGEVHPVYGYPITRWVDAPGYDIAGISRSGKVFMITRDSGGVVRNIDGWDDFIDYYEDRADDLESELVYVRENYPDDTEWIEWIESEQVTVAEQIRNGNERRASGGDVWYVRAGSCSTTSVIGSGHELYAYNRQQGQWVRNPYSGGCDS